MEPNYYISSLIILQSKKIIKYNNTLLKVKIYFIKKKITIIKLLIKQFLNNNIIFLFLTFCNIKNMFCQI